MASANINDPARENIMRILRLLLHAYDLDAEIGVSESESREVFSQWSVCDIAMRVSEDPAAFVHRRWIAGRSPFNGDLESCLEVTGSLERQVTITGSRSLSNLPHRWVPIHVCMPTGSRLKDAANEIRSWDQVRRPNAKQLDVFSGNDAHRRGPWELRMRGRSSSDVQVSSPTGFGSRQYPVKDLTVLGFTPFNSHLVSYFEWQSWQRYSSFISSFISLATALVAKTDQRGCRCIQSRSGLRLAAAALPCTVTGHSFSADPSQKSQYSPKPYQSAGPPPPKRRRLSEQVSASDGCQREESNATSETANLSSRRSPERAGSSRDRRGEMERSPSPAGSVRYTRTGRVSKAAKGQRVHTCDECGKTYTRAEHLRRHQQNHKPGAFPCDIPGCGRSFHRDDLLTRHKTRHLLAATLLALRHVRSQSPAGRHPMRRQASRLMALLLFILLKSPTSSFEV
ncbi:hypothetical protein KC362_g92 [Hortaea werneckii]|nr:hypothetical protein KC362_g92 [Hortaea werneckii]